MTRTTAPPRPSSRAPDARTGIGGAAGRPSAATRTGSGPLDEWARAAARGGRTVRMSAGVPAAHPGKGVQWQGRDRAREGQSGGRWPAWICHRSPRCCGSIASRPGCRRKGWRSAPASRRRPSAPWRAAGAVCRAARPCSPSPARWGWTRSGPGPWRRRSGAAARRSRPPRRRPTCRRPPRRCSGARPSCASWPRCSANPRCACCRCSAPAAWARPAWHCRWR